MESARVHEVSELAEFLQKEASMTKNGAIRTAVECVYGLAERYYRRNYESCGIAREEQNDKEWAGEE
jgi:hypothetical protein